MDGRDNPLLRLLDNPWVARAGNLSFLAGSGWSILKFIDGGSVNALSVLLIAVGLFLTGAQFIPRGARFGSDFPESNVYVGSKLKIKLKEEWAPISFRLVGIPLYSYARSTSSVTNVTAVVAVFKPPGKVLLDRAHGLWRELEECTNQALKAPKTGIARGIDFATDRQRHVLNVLARPSTSNGPAPYWVVVRDPLELSNHGFQLPAGQYLMSITLRSPDLRKPVRLTYDLTLPPPESEPGAPLLVGHGRPRPDWIDTQ